MDDTPPAVLALQARIWREKSFEQRMMLGAQADAVGLQAAKRLAEKRSPGDPAALFLSLHSASLSPEECRRIAAEFRRR
ncbi:MAG: hypothetical protein H6839_11105 [Planctomycetes bacterium]|nr:hypothetical protein [Planctomycetota bacterium]